jgi:hypothetical protein
MPEKNFGYLSYFHHKSSGSAPFLRELLQDTCTTCHFTVHPEWRRGDGIRGRIAIEWRALKKQGLDEAHQIVKDECITQKRMRFVLYPPSFRLIALQRVVRGKWTKRRFGTNELYWKITFSAPWYIISHIITDHEPF